MQTNIYSITEQGLEEIQPAKPLPMYCRIFAYGSFMAKREGAIISEPDRYGNYKAVYLSDYEPGFFTVDKYARPHSEKQGIGRYYADDLETVDPETVTAYIQKAEAATIQKEAKEKQLAEDNAKERAALPGLYPHLTVNTDSDSKTTKANLVAQLKKTFPGVKFSVRKRHHDSYQIEWTDGPSTRQVDEVAEMFEDHATDITGDFRDFNPSNFNRVFGGFKYIFPERNKSEQVKALTAQAEQFVKGDHMRPEEFINELFHAQGFPAGAEITGIERTEATSGSLADIYRIAFKTDSKPSGSFQIIDYSDKAIALIGDTKAIKEDLKAIGGKYNPCLKCGAGWIFSKRRIDELKVLINQREGLL